VVLTRSVVAAVEGLLFCFAAVAATLSKHPSWFIAILLGTVAGNGSFILYSIYGEFARAISWPV